jgi:endonuclease/exonuclease/phosphatase family metal-dependent hydrolase
VIAVGPFGHLYLPERLEDGKRAGLARRLVNEANIPMVMYPDGPGRAMVVNPEGQFELPRDAARVLGPLHAFPEECGRDLVAACHHAHAGDFVIAGWRPRGKPITFVWENGAHGGPGYDETHAFGLFPANAPLPHVPYLRYHQIREAALHVRGTPSAPRAFPRRRAVGEPVLRVMTYNIHGCGGMDGKVSAARIARVIAQHEPDIVALQECYGARRGDQARAIAAELKDAYHFPVDLTVLQDDYGNAIISVPKMRLVKAGKLPTLPGRSIEIRGAIWAAVEFAGAEIHFMNTHLGLYAVERQRQAEALIGPEWLGSESCGSAAILCGDFNAFPSSTVYRTLTGRLHEAQENAKGHRPRNTFFGRHPVFRIDHVFCSPGFKTVKVEVPRNHLTRLASDHLPIVAELGFEWSEKIVPAESEERFKPSLH